MEITESIKRALQEIVLPELGVIQAENREIRATLQITNKRLDDVSAQLSDQSRRIDETNKRIDETNKRVDDLRAGLTGRVDDLRAELTGRIDDLRAEVAGRIDELRRDVTIEIKETNKRIDRLYEVIVRRDEHEGLAQRMTRLEKDVSELRARIAA